MIRIGLTGSIGMGKSATSAMFRARGVPVFDADAEVHGLFRPGGAAVEPVGAAFPDAVVEGAVDRTRLSAAIRGQPEAWATLEAIVHPLVGERQRTFLAQAADDGHDLIVLDIPLLYENGGEGRVDVVVVCSAPADIQRARVLERPGMTEEKLDEILARQVPDAVKRARADFIVPTGEGFAVAEAAVDEILATLRSGTWRRREA